MGGIIDVGKLGRDAAFGVAGGEASSPGSGFESSYHSSLSTDGDGGFYTSQSSPPHSVDVGYGSTGMGFSNPFATRSENTKRRPGSSARIPPKAILPPTSTHRPISPPQSEGGPYDRNWHAPESWAVVNGDPSPIPPNYATSEEEDYGEKEKPTKRHKSGRTFRRAVNNKYSVRIHRTDGTYHVVACPVATTVLELTGVLNKKLHLDPTREPHSLYVKERERGN